ncbi:MAG TPA: phytoene desaturase family protein, partial [Anaerolineae bacterium]|nr:phytoene desaturase family protein [Anaerolineae bacterium]
MLNKPSVIMIGAGVGGLAAAAHLAQQGLHVTVLEKNQRAGGRCDHFIHDGHRFDTGPTLLVMPLVFETEFASLGASFRDRLDLQRVDPTYHLVFDDASQLVLTSDLKRMYDQLEAIEPGSFQGLLRYLVEGQQHYEVGMQSMVQKDFRTAADFFNLGNLPLLVQLKPLAQHYHHMSQYFTHSRLKSAFTFQDVYMGLSPFEAPATFSMMPYTELAHGVWYPVGGMYRIAEALVDIARQAGVEFIFDAEVERIEVDDDRVLGVSCKKNMQLRADLIVANADLPYIYHDLLPDERSGEELEHKNFSSSTISFFWGVDKVYESLGPHTLFLAD